jgi:hypothetical protein
VTDYDKSFPEISFNIWLETKNMVIQELVHPENRAFMMSIPDEDWREDFESEFSPIESVSAFFEDAEGTEQQIQPDSTQ